MNNEKVFDGLQGNWIWLKNPNPESGKYVYFRKEFSVDYSPRKVEIKIVACSTFHLFVNGEHIYYGHSVLNKNQFYIHTIDISHCISPGKILIGISVFNTNLPQYNIFSQEQGGMWAQIVANDTQTLLVTDETWTADCSTGLYSVKLKSSVYGKYAERLDFTQISRNWSKIDTTLRNEWNIPDIVIPIQERVKFLSPFILSGYQSEEIFPESAIMKGAYVRKNFSSCCEYSSIMDQSGIYVAESYFYVKNDIKLSYNFYSDVPYRFFLNDHLLRENGVNKTENGDFFNKSSSNIIDSDKPSGTFIAKAGWNRILIAQKLDVSSYGFTLNLNIDFIGFKLLREKDDATSLPGWNIIGPIKTPLDRTSHSITFPEDPETFYSLCPIDGAAFQETLNFQKYTTKMEDIKSVNFELKKDEFIILDFGNIYYGTPQFTMIGSENDIIDIICDTKLNSKGVINAFSSRRGRNTNSVILDGKENAWIDFHPRGFRYVMIVAHKVESSVLISRVSLKRSFLENLKNSYFNSSDKLLNKIWQNSENTLIGSVGLKIMDAPDRDTAQYIADSAIQTQSLFYHFGDAKSSLKALREFVAIQYETGEIPAMHPSDIVFDILDFSMIFPEWVYQYYLLTGNVDVLYEFEKPLKNFFMHLETLCIKNEPIIMLSKNSNDYFIDFDIAQQNGISVGINAFYSRALLTFAYILKQIGQRKEAEIYEEKAFTLKNIINNLCWDAETNSYRDYWANNKLSETSSWQTQILAIYGKFASSENVSKIIANNFQESAPFAKFFDEDKFYTPYFMYYVLDALCVYGYKETALNLTKFFWGAMCDKNVTTWSEFCSPLAKINKTAGASCMGYGVVPSIYIVQEIAGITPKEPGYKSIYLSPKLNMVDVLALQLPIAYGHFTIEWEKVGPKKYILRLDSFYPVEVSFISNQLENLEIELQISNSILLV